MSKCQLIVAFFFTGHACYRSAKVTSALDITITSFATIALPSEWSLMPTTAEASSAYPITSKLMKANANALPAAATMDAIAHAMSYYLVYHCYQCDQCMSLTIKDMNNIVVPDNNEAITAVQYGLDMLVKTASLKKSLLLPENDNSSRSSILYQCYCCCKG